MAARTESQFELLRVELSDMRAEMRGGFAAIRDEMRELGRRIDDTRRDMFHGAIALFGSQLALFALLLAKTL